MKKWMFLAIAILMMFILVLPIFASAMAFDTETIFGSVVVVYTDESLGSGFAVGERCIITNAHVIENNSTVMIRTYSGDSFRATVELVDKNLDIAMLSVFGTDFIPLRPAELETAKVGEDVYAIGTPNNMAYTLTKGILSAKSRKVGGRSYLQTDAAINTGNSGGPLLNNIGEVLGVNTLKVPDVEGIGLAIPITTVYSFLDGEKIPVDDDGQVYVEKMPDNSSKTENSLTEVKNFEQSRWILVLAILLGCMVALNIILIISLVYTRNKNRYRKSEPSERTDFDIDILG